MHSKDHFNLYKSMIRIIAFLCIYVASFFSLKAQELNFKVKKTIPNNAKVECLLLNKEGNVLISGDHAGYIKFWSIPDGSLLYSVKAHTGQINCITISNSGTKLVSSGADGTIKLWSVTGRKLISSYNAPYSSINFADITADERTIYYGGYHRGSGYEEVFTGFYKIDVYSKKQTKLMTDESNAYSTSSAWGITDGIIDPTDSYVIFTKGYYFYIWGIKENKMVAKYTSRFNLNNLLVTNDGNVYLWGEGMMMLREKAANYSVKNTAAGTYTSIDYYSHLNASKSGKYIVTGSDKNNINIWSSSNLAKQKTLTGHTNLVQVIVFAQNDSLLISGAYDGNIIFWENEIVKPETTVVVQQNVVPDKKPTDPVPEIRNEPVVTKVVENTKDSTTNPNSSNTVFADKNVPTSVYGRPVDMQSEVKVNKNKLRLQIWDDYSEDGDIVSVSLNGEWIIQKYTLRNEPKFIDITLKEGNNYLVLYAHNTGEVPPNTAAISTEVHGKPYRLTISSDLKISGALNIIYEP